MLIFLPSISLVTSHNFKNYLIIKYSIIPVIFNFLTELTDTMGGNLILHTEKLPQIQDIEPEPDPTTLFIESSAPSPLAPDSLNDEQMTNDKLIDLQEIIMSPGIDYISGVDQSVAVSIGNAENVTLDNTNVTLDNTTLENVILENALSENVVHENIVMENKIDARKSDSAVSKNTNEFVTCEVRI